MPSLRSTKLSPIDLVKALPAPGSSSWGVPEKAAVLLAVRSGAVSMSAACDYYTLSADLLSQWEDTLDRDGLVDLQVQRLFDRK